MVFSIPVIEIHLLNIRNQFNHLFLIKLVENLEFMAIKIA